MNKIIKNQKGFTAVEALFVIFIMAIIGAVGYMVYHNNHKTKSVVISTKTATPSKTTSSQSNTTADISNTPTDDTKVGQDLASIGQAVENIPFNDSGDPALMLPARLSDLNVKLNYDISSYPYKILEDDGGEKNSVAIYEICANFNSSTINVASINNYNGAINNPDTNSSSYSLHSKGEQCFTDSISSEVNGIDLVPSSNEGQYQGQINSVSSQNWPTDSSFHTPKNLPFN